jgi:Oxidoreductase molybdopterin binding domain
MIGSRDLSSAARSTPPSCPSLNGSMTTVRWSTAIGGASSWRGGPGRWPSELVAEHDRELSATLDCTGGWYAHQRCSGVPLDRLLLASEAEAGRSLEVRSLTGYSRRLPAPDAGRLVVATAVGGRPLSTGHGAPARLVAPVAGASGGSSGWPRSNRRTPPGGGSPRSRLPDHRLQWPRRPDRVELASPQQAKAIGRWWSRYCPSDTEQVAWSWKRCPARTVEPGSAW